MGTGNEMPSFTALRKESHHPKLYDHPNGDPFVVPKSTTPDTKKPRREKKFAKMQDAFSKHLHCIRIAS